MMVHSFDMWDVTTGVISVPSQISTRGCLEKKPGIYSKKSGLSVSRPVLTECLGLNHFLS